MDVMQTAHIAQQRHRCSLKAAVAGVYRPLNVHDRRLLRNYFVRPYRGPARGDAAVLAAAEQEQELTQSEKEDRVPLGCARYSVQLSKPLGIVLEEDKSGSIFVAEVVPGGNADRSGEVSVGDQLIATSGYTYTTQRQYNDLWVKGGEQIVRMNVLGEDFKTVMAAIGSHPAHIKVQLKFQRCS